MHPLNPGPASCLRPDSRLKLSAHYGAELDIAIGVQSPTAPVYVARGGRARQQGVQVAELCLCEEEQLQEALQVNL